MALPSQGGFSSVRQGGSYRRRRRSNGVSWIVLLVIGGITTWYFWPEDTSSTDFEMTTSLPDENTLVATPPKIADEPVEIEPTIIVEIPVISEPIEVVIAQPEIEIETEETNRSLIPLVKTNSVNLDEGLDLVDSGQIVEARQQLSDALLSGVLTESEVAQARGVLTDLSDTLVFSPYITTDDPYSIEYIIRSGDTLSGIVQKMGLQVDWRFIQRINRIDHASAIRPGQNLKLITGPFHAVVDKKAFSIDLYQGDGESRVFVRSYRVGLGEFNSTPTGLFKVRRNSKLLNPMWVNPRTAEIFASNNPLNPIGERWVGLEGMEERNKDLSGLGIHGTIEPESIGTNASMGCVRMLENDVEIVYEMLLEGVSTVEIH